MLGIVFGLLAVYWVARTIFCKRSLIQMFLAAVSLALFLLLPKEFALFPFVVIAGLLTFSLIRHIKNKNTPFRITNLAGWASLYVMGGVISLVSIGSQFKDDQVIGKVILKGHSQETWMSWKNPTQNQTESGWLPSYEVEIQDAKGNRLFSDLIMGDFVGVRAQVILIQWPYKLLGFSHLYRLELVHNGYSTAARHQFFPHVAYVLPFSFKLFEKVWNQLFLGNWQIPGVKSTTLESSYFPLREAGLTASTQEYDLVIGSTGLSARCAH
jgi:hypothetical protein